MLAVPWNLEKSQLHWKHLNGKWSKGVNFRGAWVAQSVKRLTLNLSSGLDQGHELKPHIGLNTGYEAYLKKKKKGTDFSYKITGTRDVTYNMMTIANIAVYDT